MGVAGVSAAALLAPIGALAFLLLTRASTAS